jgi:hypothetical protein
MHGYTETMSSSRVVRVVANEFLNHDSHNDIWPFRLPTEDIYGMPRELGPGPGPGPGYTFGNPTYPPPGHGPGYTFGNPMYPPPRHGPGPSPGPGYTFWNPMYPPR